MRPTRKTLDDTDREFSANFDRQASATNSVSFLGLSPPKACKTVSFFVSFHRGATQSGILFLVSIERGTSRRVYHRRPWLSDMSQLGGAPCRFLARPGCSTRRCRRTDAPTRRPSVSCRRTELDGDSCPALGTAGNLWRKVVRSSPISGRKDAGAGRVAGVGSGDGPSSGATAGLITDDAAGFQCHQGERCPGVGDMVLSIGAD